MPSDQGTSKGGVQASFTALYVSKDERAEAIIDEILHQLRVFQCSTRKAHRWFNKAIQRDIMAYLDSMQHEEKDFKNACDNGELDVGEYMELFTQRRYDDIAQLISGISDVTFSHAAEIIETKDLEFDVLLANTLVPGLKALVHPYEEFYRAHYKFLERGKLRQKGFNRETGHEQENTSDKQETDKQETDKRKRARTEHKKDASTEDGSTSHKPVE